MRKLIAGFYIVMLTLLAVTARAEQAPIKQTDYYLKHSLAEARRAGAKDSSPYAYALAVEFRKASTSEVGDVDSKSAETFRKRGLEYANKALHQAKTGEYIAYEREFAIPVGDTVARSNADRVELEQLELDFYQFVSQFAKYDWNQVAARARVALEMASEQIKETTNPEDVRKALDWARTEIEKLKTYQVGTIEFEFGKAKLVNENDPILKRALMTLQETPWTTVEIQGHTDSVGDASKNVALGSARANTVMRWLTKNGVNAKRLRTKAFGESRPMADNKTDEGRQKNRRIEFVNTGKLYEKK